MYLTVRVFACRRVMAARLVAAPVSMAVSLACGSAYLSGTVTSHASDFPSTTTGLWCRRGVCRLAEAGPLAL